MGNLAKLEPQKVFQYFEELNQIPRGTYNTKKVSDYLKAFAKSNGLEYYQDEVNDIIIKKPGSLGYENSEPIIIQGHMDMVCEKTSDSLHDFLNDPIEMFVEDGFVKARDTTLGADNGIAIAYAMAILSDDTLSHPPLEVMITVDEEVGMTGASSVDLTLLKGKNLINLDTDEEGTLIAGCAGGFRGAVHIPIVREQKTGTPITIYIKGLLGGHSGGEIHKQRGNAHKMMGRLLLNLSHELNYLLIDWNGGSADNVIPSACITNILIPTDELPQFETYLETIIQVWKLEFDLDEPDFIVSYESRPETSLNVISEQTTKSAVFFIACTPNGVQCYSRQLPGLVETSINLGVVKTMEETLEIWFMGRSLIDSKKIELTNTLIAFANTIGAAIDIVNDYPGWMYKTDSVFRQVVIDSFKKYYQKEPLVTTVHAGLECGILSGRKPDLDCISFGPIMYDIHSTNERLDIASTKRTYEFLLEILKACQ
ncbi:MAG: aminoacyl-histidine dipeptidase [Lachnospiraceae bacterium]|nr:aminoacyl-histidine dipeptidase [Lachnospiraceae bacterium]